MELRRVYVKYEVNPMSALSGCVETGTQPDAKK